MRKDLPSCCINLLCYVWLASFKDKRVSWHVCFQLVWICVNCHLLIAHKIESPCKSKRSQCSEGICTNTITATLQTMTRDNQQLKDNVVLQIPWLCQSLLSWQKSFHNYVLSSLLSLPWSGFLFRFQAFLVFWLKFCSLAFYVFYCIFYVFYVFYFSFKISLNAQNLAPTFLIPGHIKNSSVVNITFIIELQVK